jgi:hypothetical protein
LNFWRELKQRILDFGQSANLNNEFEEKHFQAFKYEQPFFKLYMTYGGHFLNELAMNALDLNGFTVPQGLMNLHAIIIHCYKRICLHLEVASEVQNPFRPSVSGYGSHNFRFTKLIF